MATVDTSGTSPAELAKVMVGREVLSNVEKVDTIQEQVVVQVTDLSARTDKGLPALRQVSFQIRRGEILGIAGVSGNGQKELVEALTGTRAVTSGQYQVAGRNLTNTPPRTMLHAGVGYIPEDRLAQGVAGSLSVADNLALGRHHHSFSRGLAIDYGAMRRHAQELVRDFDVRTPSVDVPVRSLSGGNIQKLILARELSRQPIFLIAHQPTRGLDVGATEYVRQKLVDAKKAGVAILLISEDLDEVLDLADRVTVLYEGHLTMAPPGADHHTIGLMMAGEKT
ncbi:MAG: ATP-binding cassette domain-containing protein [Deinococcus sp.]|nr:ATP-binding cassette domain-containing protein [Deinococcus sp.]